MRRPCEVCGLPTRWRRCALCAPRVRLGLVRRPDGLHYAAPPEGRLCWLPEPAKDALVMVWPAVPAPSAEPRPVAWRAWWREEVIRVRPLRGVDRRRPVSPALVVVRAATVGVVGLLLALAAAVVVVALVEGAR